MDKIKDFFQKKKADVKFKKAGKGHSLTSSSSSSFQPPRSAAAKPEVVRQKPLDPDSVQAKQHAAQAALKRLEVNAGKQQASRSSQTIKLQAKRQLEAEHFADNVDAFGPRGPEEKVFDAAPVLAVSGVFFTCELLGDDIYLTKDDMCDAVEAFLLDSFADDPLVSSSIMIHSLNRNRRERDVGIEVLSKYIDNLITAPDEDKFRRIRKSNKVYVEKVAHIKGSTEFLKTVGFKEVEENGESFLVMPREACDAGRLVQAKECLVNGQPMPLKLYRNPSALKPSVQPLSDLGLPSDFFERSALEIKVEQREKEKELDQMLTLRTREMRERDELKRIYKYKFTLLRVRFPDGYMLQGTFKSTEMIDAVETFVRQHIECDWIPFVLKDARGEAFKGVRLEKTLAELNLAPAAVLHLELDAEVVRDYAAAGQQVPEHLLKSDLIEEANELSH